MAAEVRDDERTITAIPQRGLAAGCSKGGLIQGAIER